MSRAPSSEPVVEAAGRQERVPARPGQAGVRPEPNGRAPVRPAPPAAPDALARELAPERENGGYPCVVEPDDLPERVARLCSETPWELYLPERARDPMWGRFQLVKRWLDVILAGLGVVILAPLLLLVAIVVKATSHGPVLYAFTALGYRGRPFVCYKFRTMTMDAERQKRDLLHLNEMSGPAFKMRQDPRVTRPGRLLRRTSLDELPQLWNVLRGEMSLVGPRPPLPEEFVHYEPWHRGRLAVTPGMTCLWQVLGRNEIRDFDTWMELDREYVRNWSLALDMKLLLRTIPAVVLGKGAY